MAASINDKLRKGYQTFSTTLASQKAASATTMSLSSATGIPTTTAIDFTVGRVDANGNRTPTTKAVYKGTLSGTTVSNLTLIEGTDQLHAAGTVVEITFTASMWNDMVDHNLVEHNQNGTHAAITTTSVTSSGAISGTTITGSSLVSTGDVQLRSTSLETIASERFFDHVASGCVWSGDAYASTRNASMTSGVVYIGGKRVSVSAVTARSFTASKDTYIDVDNTGTITYTEVANNAASPALAANNIRLGIIVTGATNIAAAGSVNQGQETMVLPIASSVPYAVTDSLGNLICPRDPQRKILGYRQITSNFSTTSTTDTQVTGLSAPIIVPSGRKIKVTFSSFNIGSGSAGQTTWVSIWNGTVGSGTQLGGNQLSVGAVAAFSPSATTVVVTPSTTSLTVNVGLKTSTGTSVTLSAGAGIPAVVLVELV